MSNQCRVDNYFDKCVYKECKNGKFSHGKRLFRFPMQKDRRFNIWIRNTGNTNLEKLSANTLRKLGLCEDHFLVTSFTNATKERLNRNAVPIAYGNAGSSTNEQNVEDKMQRDITAALSPNDGDLIVKKQMSEECALRTYRAALNFEMSAEEENIIEWMHLEPPIRQDVECNNTERNVKCKDDSIQRNYKEKSNLVNAKIKALRIENCNLQQKIKRLESQMQRIAKKCKCKSSNKKEQKKKF